MQFSFSLGGALSLSIAQTIFANKLASQIKHNVPHLSFDTVIAAGAYGLSGLAEGSKETLVLLRKSYEHALRDVFVYALIAGGMALLFSLCFEHQNIQQVAKKRQEKEDVVDLGSRKS